MRDPGGPTEDAVIFAGRDGLIRFWNDASERLFGYAAPEALGESLDLIIPERFRDAHWQAYDRAIASGQTKYEDRVLTTRSARKDGRKLYLDLGFTLVKDPGGAVIGALAVGRDCTDRYLAQRANQQQGQQ